MSADAGNSPAAAVSLPVILFVTGTDTGVGKTMVTAALAAALQAAGKTVAVYKPTQAGVEDGADVEHVQRLAGVADVHEGIRLPYPMAPVAAADRAGLTLPTAADHVVSIKRLATAHQHTLVEGAGGVLVQLDSAGKTLAEIAALTAATCTGSSSSVIVVCRAALGTLNHTELTVEALRRRGVTVLGLVIGSWPETPSEIDASNRGYLSAHAVPLIGLLPEGAGQLEPSSFRDSAPEWFNISF